MASYIKVLLGTKTQFVDKFGKTIRLGDVLAISRSDSHNIYYGIATKASQKKLMTTDGWVNCPEENTIIITEVIPKNDKLFRDPRREGYSWDKNFLICYDEFIELFKDNFQKSVDTE